MLTSAKVSVLALLAVCSSFSTFAQKTANSTAKSTVPSARVALATPQPAPAKSVVKATTSADHKAKYLNVGVGLAAYYGGGFPLGFSLEGDVKNNISVGGSVDYFRYNYYSAGHYTFVYAGARASYHLDELLDIQDKKFDPYVGASLGFRYAGYNDAYGNAYDYNGGYNSGLFLGAHVGARYLIGPKVGVFAEVGYGVSALKVGLSAKF